MFLQGESVEAGKVLEADLCIVGSGVAGTTIAQSWLGRSEKVLVVEAGRKKYDAEIQALYGGKLAGSLWGPNDQTYMTTTRHRV